MKYGIFTALLFGICTIQAQFHPTIRTGRPGNTIGPFTAGKGVLQFQQGIGYRSGSEEMVFNPPSGAGSSGLGGVERTTWENVVRMGILEKLELNAAVNYSWSNRYFSKYYGADPHFPSGNDKRNELQNFDVGLRYNILDGTNAAGLAWGIQARAGLLPLLDEKRDDTPLVHVITALGRNFFEAHSLRVNLGMIVSGGGESFTYGANYVFRPVPKFGIALEYFGESGAWLSSISNPWYRHNYELSLLYLLTDDIQVDIRSGYQQKEFYWVDANYFAGAGISWRLKAS